MDDSKSNDQQPQLKPVKKEYEEFTKMRNEAGKRAVEEMLKRPYTLEQALENQTRLRKGRKGDK